MVISGNSLVVIFGCVFVVPPLGLGMYAGISLANSDFGKTFKNNL